MPMIIVSCNSFIFEDISIYNDLDEIIEVQEIALARADSHEYIREVYDCSEFSRDLVKDLNRIGYNAEVVYGFVDDYNYYLSESGDISLSKASALGFDEGHAWVRVYINQYPYYIESVTGVILNNKKIIPI